MDKKRLGQFRSSLRELERELIGQLKEDNVCFGVSVSQCHILLEIGHKGEASIVELAPILNLDTSTLSRAVDGLVSIGLVKRRQNPNDRRYVCVSLSLQGQKVFSSIEGANNAYLSRIFMLIPEDKHETVVESFLLFFEAMKAVKSENPSCRKETHKGGAQ